jgi:hypothetical protein
MMFPVGETVTRLRATATTDPYSDEPDDLSWTSPSSLVIPGCGFDPGGSTETNDARRDAVTTQPTVYAPPDADIGPADRLSVRGVTYEVDGRPGLWRSPFTGWEPGLVVPLRLFEG